MIRKCGRCAKYRRDETSFHVPIRYCGEEDRVIEMEHLEAAPEWCPFHDNSNQKRLATI